MVEATKRGLMKRLEGKVALITGAGGDIGRAICLRFAAEGASVICNDIDPRSAEETVGEIGARSGVGALSVGDVSDSAAAQAAVHTAVERFGGLHILVNNAAFFLPDATLPELDEALFARAVAVNLTGVFLMSRHAIPHIACAGGGSIIHIASQQGRVARPKQATYSATKAALILLAKGMALDHAGDGIRVNTLSPGGIATRGMAERWGDMDTAEREWGKRMHPLGRLGRMDEIASAALFLASDESSFMTGADLLVDGGYTAW
jgi:NAD(P)-dependent dehydrogenase (short-subunit alcohol dehydrogenase family)